MLLMTSHHPQRRRRSRPRVLCAFIGAQRRALTDARAKGTSATDAQPLCFQNVHAQQPPRLHRTAAEECFFPLAADSTRVHPQQPVNTSLFTHPACRTLIPDTFPQSNFRFPHSSHLGVTCRTSSRCRAPCFFSRSPQLPMEGSRRSKAAPEERPAGWVQLAAPF